MLRGHPVAIRADDPGEGSFLLDGPGIALQCSPLMGFNNNLSSAGRLADVVVDVEGDGASKGGRRGVVGNGNRRGLRKGTDYRW